MSQPADSLISRLVPPLVWKVGSIGIVLLLLLIALAQVRGLLSERERAREFAAQRVRDSVGAAQKTGVVVLSVPVITTRVVEDKLEQIESVTYVLPDTLQVDVAMRPDVRRSGLYAIPAFAATVTLDGAFAARDLAALRAVVPGRTVRFEDARLLILSSEARSLRAFDRFDIAGQPVERGAGGYADLAGASGSVPTALLRAGEGFKFGATYQLVGTEDLLVPPLGRSATLRIRSSWPHPSFIGAQSPIRSAVTPQGFDAEWRVLELSRGFGQTWQDAQVRDGLSAADAIDSVKLGVKQYQSVDVYQRNYRAMHYALLVIAITFMTFFLLEQVLRKPLHGMQYLFVGLALAVFYLLLLALSEHLAFGVAYLIAAIALVALVAIYLQGALRSTELAAATGGGLAVIYGLMYVIMVSEDYSLLMGALLLFGVLAILMIATRRFDWSNAGNGGTRTTE